MAMELPGDQPGETREEDRAFRGRGAGNAMTRLRFGNRPSLAPSTARGSAFPRRSVGPSSRPEPACQP